MSEEVKEFEVSIIEWHCVHQKGESVAVFKYETDAMKYVADNAPYFNDHQISPIARKTPFNE
jgi:hypothetical protein